MDSDAISEGDYVLVYVDSKRSKVVRVSRGARFESDKGVLDLGSVIGLHYGSQVSLSTGIRAYLLKPLHIDLASKFKRVTQVIYPKDAGFMILLSGISSGSNVLEIGVGTGYLTSFIANAVRPSGQVVGYEVRPEYAEVAMRNLAKLGLDRNVVIKVADARQGIEKLDDRGFDAVFIDMPDPWNVYLKLREVVRPSAPVLTFLPTVSQVIKILDFLETSSCGIDIRVYETILREFEPNAQALRPRTLYTAHTGYIVFFRLI
ncbi:MAG: tRNA (adenine-N1)-methyltransferase [Sulfolobales archaeon]|nr:tRNA (adenine-N1)-methyltransferase [Sulfolobales archaeon]MDW8083552.1 tRNA (adenine-N1)-methyltransferase [Sulfolobales archaeon]